MPDIMDTNHVDAETLEGYALDSLAEPELAVVAEHLLICDECRRLLAEKEERYAKIVREAREAVSLQKPTAD
jgi:anti-sigma factor ChrR (cupin superfamily)